MEKPRIDKHGGAQWRPRGRRQRFAKALLDHFGVPHVVVAAANLMAKEQGVTELNVTKEEVADYVQWLDEAGLQRLLAVAEGIEEIPTEH